MTGDRLRIYNSLTRQKAIFEPIEPGCVRMYVCGMTIYDFCHVGHGRMLVVFDMVARYLRWLGYRLIYVRNITDIDDKIIRRAQEQGIAVSELTCRYIDAMHEDMAQLGVLPPDSEPRATQSMDEIKALIATLLDKGFAYRVAGGDIYYAVSRFAAYGQLSGKNPADLRAGARVEINEAKRDPLDFVLWKAAKPGEPVWDAPWGPGRPGWHIECSAMSMQALGSHFDIHGGGQDLQFPHHENEIAQSEAVTCEHFVNYWMHNGFVRLNEEKMSKSLGNFFTLREVFAHFPPEAVRYFILLSHYRSPLNYSGEQLQNARAALDRLYTALRGLPDTPEPEDRDIWVDRFEVAMNDDFNTPEALAVLFDLAREINRHREQTSVEAMHLRARLRQLGGVLGLLPSDPEAWLKAMPAESELNVERIEVLIEARTEARKRQDFAAADRIRTQLEAGGILLEDNPLGTLWRHA